MSDKPELKFELKIAGLNQHDIGRAAQLVDFLFKDAWYSEFGEEELLAWLLEILTLKLDMFMYTVPDIVDHRAGWMRILANAEQFQERLRACMIQAGLIGDDETQQE